MLITSKDISVVVQGPIEWEIDKKYRQPLTLISLLKIRELLPESEIILSTWKDTKVDALEFDKICQSKDPGPQGNWPGFTLNNVNRQIKSAISGINLATRKFCLKIRSDMVLEGLNFIKIFMNREEISPDQKKIFDYPIITNNFSSRNTKKLQEKYEDYSLLFHPSDHIQFGLCKDIQSLWDIPFQSDLDSIYFLEMTYPNRWRHNELSRLTPEQFIFINAINKNLGNNYIQLKNYASSSNLLEQLSEYYMNSHIVSIPDQQYQVYFPKYHTDHHFSFDWMRQNDLLESEVVNSISKYKTIRWKGIENPNISLKKRLTFPFRRPELFLERIKSGRYFPITFK